MLFVLVRSESQLVFTCRNAAASWIVSTAMVSTISRLVGIFHGAYNV
jgi:hypothetical protein